jgi:NADH:ubiquinone oxidoreductase subunit 6 (subunit J)
MDPYTTYIFILQALLVILAIIAAEHKNIGYSVLSLFIITVLTGILFYIVGAFYVSIVQIAVFSGAIMIFFIMVFIMTRGGKESG